MRNRATKKYFELPTLEMNAENFSSGKPKEERIGASQIGGLVAMLRLFGSQINRSKEVLELDPSEVPSFKTYVSSLEKKMRCTRKTVKNRLKHYQKCGAITKIENHGMQGIRIWFHPDIVFKNQKGFENYTAPISSKYIVDQTEPPVASDNVSSSHTSTELLMIRDHLNFAETGKKIVVSNPSQSGKTEKITPISSCPRTINTYTTAVNKLVTTKSNQSEGVPPEQRVLPVPSSVGKGENPRTPPRTKESCPKKNLRQRKVAPNRAPKNLNAEIPISQKNGTGGVRRDFLLSLIKQFWDYAQRKLYPGIILLESEERTILNHIWCSVFKKLPPGYSEKEWIEHYKISCKQVDKAVLWMETQPTFELPVPQWYFNPKNTRGVGFYKMRIWQREDERRAVISRIKKEVNLYSRGKGRLRNKTPLELFRKHERLIFSFNDEALSEMFRKMAKEGRIYGKLKSKQTV